MRFREKTVALRELDGASLSCECKERATGRLGCVSVVHPVVLRVWLYLKCAHKKAEAFSATRRVFPRLTNTWFQFSPSPLVPSGTESSMPLGTPNPLCSSACARCVFWSEPCQRTLYLGRPLYPRRLGLEEAYFEQLYGHEIFAYAWRLHVRVKLRMRMTLGKTQGRIVPPSPRD